MHTPIHLEAKVFHGRPLFCNQISRDDMLWLMLLHRHRICRSEKMAKEFESQICGQLTRDSASEKVSASKPGESDQSRTPIQSLVTISSVHALTATRSIRFVADEVGLFTTNDPSTGTERLPPSNDTRFTAHCINFTSGSSNNQSTIFATSFPPQIFLSR